MKEGWGIRKLGEIGVVVGGSTPKTNVSSYWGEGHYWITPAELDGSKYVGATARTITDEALKHTNLSLLPIGTVLLSSRAPIGKVAITTVPMYCNQGFKNIICGPDINNEYVYWFLIHIKDYLVSLGRGATFKEISKHIVEQVFIPVPPLNEQVKVAAELNCLSNIIEKKKQQLEELDKLAQSIFYDMFGDPITNEKGWEVKKLGDLCEVITKGTTPSSLGFSFVEEGINFLKVESFNSDETLNEAKIFHITKECDAALRRSRLEANDILMCIAGATCGRLAIVPSSVIPANTNQAFGIIRLKDKEQSFHRYIYSFLHSSFIRESVNDLMKGVAQPNLTLAHLRGFSILLPPPALQNEFAQKVEAIEKQKELVKQSIMETETLFNSRMDFWFNN